MKRTLLILVLALLAVPAFAGVPKKSELTLGASFVKPKEGGSSYLASGALLVPVFGGKLHVGPQAVLSDSEAARSVGIVGELDVKTFFLGASYDYFLEDVAGLDKGAASVRAGFKSKGSGFVKVYAERVVQGRGKDDADYSGFVAIGKRF